MNEVRPFPARELNERLAADPEYPFGMISVKPAGKGWEVHAFAATDHELWDIIQTIESKRRVARQREGICDELPSFCRKEDQQAQRRRWWKFWR